MRKRNNSRKDVKNNDKKVKFTHSFYEHFAINQIDQFLLKHRRTVLIRLIRGIKNKSKNRLVNSKTDLPTSLLVRFQIDDDTEVDRVT